MHNTTVSAAQSVDFERATYLSWIGDDWRKRPTCKRMWSHPFSTCHTLQPSSMTSADKRDARLLICGGIALLALHLTCTWQAAFWRIQADNREKTAQSVDSVDACLYLVGHCCQVLRHVWRPSVFPDMEGYDAYENGDDERNMRNVSCRLQLRGCYRP